MVMGSSRIVEGRLRFLSATQKVRMALVGMRGVLRKGKWLAGGNCKLRERNGGYAMKKSVLIYMIIFKYNVS